MIEDKLILVDYLVQKTGLTRSQAIDKVARHIFNQPTCTQNVGLGKIINEGLEVQKN